MNDYNLYWGDTHTNIHARDVGRMDSVVQSARDMLDFWPIAYYPQEIGKLKGFPNEDWLPQTELDAQWRVMCASAAANNDPGTFVAFAGYEWQGDGTSGDHNVFYLLDDGPFIRCDSLTELYSRIRAEDLKAFAIPHHTAYRVGIRGKDWSVHDAEISPWAEIFSVHGCSESDEEWFGLRRNGHMGPGHSGGTIEDALSRGIRTGIICSGDSHSGFAGVYGNGLMGCYASALTREALWEAFGARRVYGVSADRIALDFSVNDAPMGAEIEAGGPVRCVARVRGSDAVDRIELLRNNRVIATHCHNGTWDVPGNDDPMRCKFRVEVGWGGDGERNPEDGQPRQWDGELRIDGGRILSVEKCWIHAGQRVDPPGDSVCSFEFTTRSEGTAQRGRNQANVFEIEGRPSSRMILKLNGKTVETTLGEAMRRSTVVDYMEETVRWAKDKFGVDAAALPRRDWLYFLGHKAKLHRAIPESGLAAELVFEDAAPPTGVNQYRVRVSQRNGAMAWSSPVWVHQ